jgi:hypothetical protein
MNYWSYHHQFNAMPFAIADIQRINGVVSLGQDCIPISVNPAYLYLSAHFLARAEKARLLCDLGKALVERSLTRSRTLEERIWHLDHWLESGCRLKQPCSVTNALTIRTRRQPLRVTPRNIRDYLCALANDSMPHQLGEQFKFFVGDYGKRVVLFTTEDLHFLKLSICSGVTHRSMPYPSLDHLCNDALGGNQEFLKMRE